MLRAAITLAALAIVRAQPPPPSAFVEVISSGETEEIEKRYTPELLGSLRAVKDEVLLLYTEHSARTGAELKLFLQEMRGFGNETMDGLDIRAPQRCRDDLEQRIGKIRYDVSKAATFSAENHHKFFLGHMIVFRMHLNKSEEFISKSDRTVRTCGIACETIPKVTRWRRQALKELHRVQDDIQHSRRSFKDLVTHARRRLNSLKKQARTRAQDAVYSFQVCSDRG